MISYCLQSIYKSCRLDVSGTSGGLLLYVKQGLSYCRLTKFSIPEDVQVLPIEICLKSCKWLIVSIYRPPKQNISYFLSNLSNLLDYYHYDRCVIMGDFNIDPENDLLSEFLESQTLHNHVNFKTCFKSPEGSCIDLILSNKKQSLQYTGSFNTGLSDYHHLIYTFLKSTYVKIPPKEIVYREFKNFSNEAFLSDLKVSLD